MLIPRFIQAWRERRSVLGEFSKQDPTTVEYLEMRARWILEEAKVAFDTGQHDLAWVRWSEAFEKHPAETKRSHLALEILFYLRRVPEAEAIIEETRKRRPSDKFYAEAHARIPQLKGDHNEALRRWKRVRKRFPASIVAYTFAGEALEDLGRLDEAEALMKTCLRKFTHDIGSRIQYAKLAAARKDNAEALLRWESVRDAFDHVIGYRGVAFTLQELGRLDEAEEAMKAARARFPLETALAIDLAGIAILRGDTEEAIRRWRVVQERFPLEQAGYKEGAKLLLKLGRYEEADAVLVEGIDRFPKERVLLVDYALSAHLAHNWPEVLRRCEAIRSEFPDCEESYTWAAAALARLGETAAAEQMTAASKEHARSG